MANERETVSLQGMIRWALAECAAREIDALPDIQELNALYPDTAAFRRRVFSAIGKWKKQEKRRPLRVLKHIIVAAAVLISVLFGTLMVNASVRTAVVNTIIEWTERSIGIQFQVEGATLAALPEGYGPHYIPEGLMYQEELSWRTEAGFSYGYESENGDSILNIEVCIAENGSGYYLDDEHAEHERITFHGVTAYYGHGTSVGGDEICTLLWVEHGIEHYIYTNVPVSELLAIAEQIY